MENKTFFQNNEIPFITCISVNQVDKTASIYNLSKYCEKKKKNLTKVDKQ